MIDEELVDKLLEAYDLTYILEMCGMAEEECLTYLIEHGILTVPEELKPL